MSIHSFEVAETSQPQPEEDPLGSSVATIHYLATVMMRVRSQGRTGFGCFPDPNAHLALASQESIETWVVDFHHDECPPYIRKDGTVEELDTYNTPLVRR